MTEQEQQNVLGVQMDASVCYRNFKELHDIKKEAMLGAFNQMRERDSVDAETAFFTFGETDAAEIVNAINRATRPQDVAGLVAGLCHALAFLVMEQLKAEGKIKEDEK